MPKKNLSSPTTGNSLSNLFRYSWPKLHEGKQWYVDFVAFDPAAQMMRRKKFMIEKSILKATDKRRRGAEIIKLLTDKLSKGWNPWVNESSSRGYTALSVVFDRYLEYISKSDRAKTRHSYTSRLNVLKTYIEQMPIPIHYVYQYNRDFVSDFLDYIYLDRECGARTRNNYRGWCSSFGEWLRERRYIETNPCSDIPKVKEHLKKRKDLNERMLREMNDYLMMHNKHFLLACMMEYYTLIRPMELSHIRISDISVKKQAVFVSGEFSKNKRDGNVGLNETLILLMVELGVFSYPGDYYLFGRGFRPSAKRVSPDQFNKAWVKMRKRLGWSDEFQFYSLKDTGIRDLANAIGIVVARDQARHADISTTNKYLRGRDKRVPEETKKFKGSLG